ncbi:tagaturonate reductase [Ammoniphilus sp. YIM 78166]|uniref:tagaturonate reductase n=1 Tax=Ammoniphilus sp. YIM 78166 TaxID=1644106 RepID=UPI001F0F2ECA|nr:tagaturonate reductase [Ammoniphilus sp. YIM 78166]
MQKLTKQLIPADQRFDHLPEKIIQFGEGNFLRGFVDWMVQECNKQGLFNGRVVAIQPTPHGKVVPKLNAQDGLYTLVIRGIENEQVIDRTEVISSISRGINPYTDWAEVLKVAENPEVQFVFSNTTEAGLTYAKEEYNPEQAPLSYPGKLAAFLYHRYQTNGTGMAIFPCELVESNGDLLKEIVLTIAEDWKLPEAFKEWINEHNLFCNTLVDRIVTGFPKDSIEEYRERLGYDDELLTVGEPYHLFAIEAPEKIADAIPFHLAGLNVHWADVRSFREIKVRILNGAHTLMVPVAFQAGKDTVLEAMEEATLRPFIEKGIYQEIFPILEMPIAMKKPFADSVIERFLNPFNKHYLRDIALNSFYKFRTRLLPTLLETIEQQGKPPEAISFSFAALLSLYRGKQAAENELTGIRGEEVYSLRDQPEVVTLLASLWSAYEHDALRLEELVGNVLNQEAWWGQDLTQVPHLAETVYSYLSQIVQHGMRESLLNLTEGK